MIYYMPYLWVLYSAMSSLSLARWEYWPGRSDGFWLVREVPGLALRGSGRPKYQRWNFCLVPGSHYTQAKSPSASSLLKAWGHGFSSDRAEQLLAVHPQLRGVFSTRRDALGILEGVLFEPAPSGSGLVDLA